MTEKKTMDRYELYRTALKKIRYWNKQRDEECLAYFARGALLMADMPYERVKACTADNDSLIDLLVEIWDRGQPLIEDEMLAKAFDIICAEIAGVILPQQEGTA